MKLRTTLVLLIIAVALGAFIFGLDRWSRSTRERRERAAHVVSVTRANIQGFTIRDGDELIRVRAEGDAWKMIAPWQDDADAGVVDQLLDAIQSLRPEDVITDLGKIEKKRQMLKDFGLNKSRLRLKLDGKQMPAELQFGLDTAVQGESYLRIADDDAVYVVNDDLKNIVSKKPEDFRDHRMTPFLTTLINRAIFRVSGGEIELAKEQDNWQLVRPIKGRASNDAVVDILTRMNQTQITKFVSDENQIRDLLAWTHPLMSSPCSATTERRSRSRSGGRSRRIRTLCMQVFRNGSRLSKSARLLPICSTSLRMTSVIERSRE